MPRKSWGKPIEYSVVREGKKADLLVFTRNPLKDFNLLYGTEALRLDPATGAVHREVILHNTPSKGGVVYNSQKLLAKVCSMEAAAKAKAGPSA